LPGEKGTFTYKDEEGKEGEFEANYIVVNYGDSLDEFLNIPYYENVNCSFIGWRNWNGSRFTFPYAPVFMRPRTSYSLNGKEVKYVDYIYPELKLTYKATIINGENTETANYIVKVSNGVTYEIPWDRPAPENAVFEGWYEDAECTKPFEVKFGDVKVYAGWKKQIQPMVINCTAGYENYYDLPEAITEGSGYTELHAICTWESSDGIQAALQLMDNDRRQASSTLHISKTDPEDVVDCLNGATYIDYNINPGSPVVTPCADSATQIQFYIQNSSYSPTTGTITVKKIWLTGPGKEDLYLFHSDS
jgi:hypothetical protein